MMRPQCSKQLGFTLLEVIVAVVIAALCLSALSQVFATGVRSASASSDYMRAMTLAQGLLAGAGIEKALSDGDESGVSSDGRLQWSLTVAPEPVEEGDALIKPPLELKRLVARVAVSIEADVGMLFIDGFGGGGDEFERDTFWPFSGPFAARQLIGAIGKIELDTNVGAVGNRLTARKAKLLRNRSCQRAVLG